MSKSALGKGLGNLMEGDRVAGSPMPSTTAKPFSPQIRNLIQPQGSESRKSQSLPRIPVWYWFGLDLILCIGAFGVVRVHPTFLGFSLAAVAVITGLVFALFGTLTSPEDQR